MALEEKNRQSDIEEFLIDDITLENEEKVPDEASTHH